MTKDGTPISENDFPKIEEKMREFAKRDEAIVRREVSKADALKEFKANGQEYKCEHIDLDLEDGTISTYSQGEFTDLCRGPHLTSTGAIKAVKLTSVAGAFWRGDAEKDQLTRIYGITFPKKKMLDEYLVMLEEAKKQYPVIRMAYERSEPIAESFGELDVNIDFRLADYLEENKTEEGWRGFHRIEKIMWEQNTTKGTEEYADQLVKDIKELKAKVATVEVTPDLMVTGAVDLLNEVATQKITGEEEIYSHTDLYDFKANIEGAEEIFKIFKPLIEKKDSKLAKDLTEKFATINGLLDKYKTDDKHYKLYTDLTKENTKELSEAVTKLGEPLSQMGVILDEEAK